MPYIEEQDRRKVWRRFHRHHEVLTPGDLAYMIAELMDCYVGSHGLSYATLATAEGVLATSLEEFHERITKPYEHLKRCENGDAYGRSRLLLEGLGRISA